MLTHFLSLWLTAAPTPSAPTAVTPLPIADPSVREFPACRMGFVSFRSRDEGWAGDHCGHLFHTTNGGRGWRRDRTAELHIFKTPLPRPGTPETEDDRGSSMMRFAGHLEFMHWFSADEAVAGGYTESKFFRTADGGKSWAAVPTPTSQWVYATFARGDSMWTCGSSGAVIRALDRGRTWTLMKSPMNDVDRCIRLDFSSPSRGLATGWFGARYVSTDNGMTWTHEPSSPSPVTVEPAGSGPSSLHFEPDGGLSSVAVPARERLKFDGPGEVSAWGKGQVRLVDDGLRFEAAEGVRIQPLLTEARGPSERLRTAERAGDFWYGLGARHLYLSYDGATWFARSELPVPSATRVTFLGVGHVVLETPKGLFRSDDEGRTWQSSVQPQLDLSDVARLRGEAAGVNDAPLKCLKSTSEGKVAVTFSTQGCFGGSQNALEVVIHRGNATLSGALQYADANPTLRGVALTLEERQSLLSSLEAAMTRPEEEAGCSSTTGHQVEVTWSCGGTESKATFETYACDHEGEKAVGASTSFFRGAKPGYARALGLTHVARDTLARHGAK